MTIRIKATRATILGCRVFFDEPKVLRDGRVRVVRETDWRRLMRLMRAAEGFNRSLAITVAEYKVITALDALKERSK